MKKNKKKKSNNKRRMRTQMNAMKKVMNRYRERLGCPTNNTRMKIECEF